jgi:hypothetical protein
MPSFAWPLCVCGTILILGLVLMFRHRDDLSRLIGRTKHIGKGGITTSDATSLATQNDTKDVGKPSAADELLQAFDNQLLVEQEGIISNFLDEKQVLDPRERGRVLTRYLASAYIVGRFEAIYSSIFGSQIQALQMLNQSPGVGLPTTTLEGWYQVGVAGFPNMYGPNGENYAFGQWLGYVYRWGLITIVGTEVHITVNGQEFLKYLVQNSYGFDKVG